ncbi:hypothetical protein RN001_003497 [Aquatica leii]|uniref:Uncharacterized protein n=1 Tax=Aquatica leii TaxID=1421715 RepID=A0AAN7PR68_9COLE|nr:hypothetical protein RN001_003497 [Aquatica leii]
MAAKYKIVASHLELDELIYELEYRGFPTSCDINCMRKELRKILNLERIGHGSKYPECNKTFSDEIQACNDKISVLSEKISEFTARSDRKEFLILNSRLSHLMARADRLPMTNEQEKVQRASTITKILKISETLNETLKLRKSHNDTVSFLQSDSGSDEEDIGNAHASTPSRLYIIHAFEMLLKIVLVNLAVILLFFNALLATNKFTDNSVMLPAQGVLNEFLPYSQVRRSTRAIREEKGARFLNSNIFSLSFIFCPIKKTFSFVFAKPLVTIVNMVWSFVDLALKKITVMKEWLDDC